MRKRRPQGKLIPIGGREDKEDHKDVLRRVIEESGKKKPKVCLITVASSVPKEIEHDYKNAFRSLGIHDLSIIHFEARTEADDKRHFEKIKKCHVAFFSGGNQLKLSSLIGGTELMKRIKERYYSDPTFVIAGSSAGAAAMSDTMIIRGSSQDAMIKGELELTNGLDLIDSVFIDTHFTERGRFGRLIQTVTCNPGVMGLGLGEDTAVVIKKGEEMEVVGSGLCIIVDGTCIDFTDLTEISNGTPITVEGIKMHVLGPGKKFLLSKKMLKNTVGKKKF
jgi:cyanophycinase